MGNPNKTGLVVFTSRRNSLVSLNHTFLGVTLLRSMSVKYHRVVLDSRLTWREHVDVKVRKAHNLLWACRRVYGATWGLRPKAVHWLYISIIRPSITSASLVWCPGFQTVSAKKRLSRVQRLACLGLTGAMCTTLTITMAALIGLPPLELLVQNDPRLATHCLWSLRCWSYLHPSQGHCSILIRLQ